MLQMPKRMSGYREHLHPFFTAMTTTTVGSSDTRWTSSAPDTEVAWDPLEHFQLDQQQLLAIVDEAFGTVPRITADTR